MSERPSWFRCDASRLLGALGGMGPDCGYLYTVILMRIYEVGGPIEDDCGTLARRTGMALKRVTGALTWLLAKGKVERLPDGLLDSETTHEELAHRKCLFDGAKKAGEASAKRRAEFSRKKNQRKQQNPPTVVEQSLSVGATDGQRLEGDIEGDQEKNRDPNGSLVETPVSTPSRKEKRKEEVDLIQSVVCDWNALAAKHRLPEVRDITVPRQSAILARAQDLVKTYDFNTPSEGFHELIARVGRSPFLRGETTVGFRCDLDFIVCARTFTRIMEGKYEGENGVRKR